MNSRSVTRRHSGPIHVCYCPRFSALRKAIDGKEAELGLALTPRRSSRHPAKALANLADDVVLLSDNTSRAQILQSRVESKCLRIGQQVNDKKKGHDTYYFLLHHSSDDEWQLH